MDSFWGPIITYCVVIAAGLLIAALGAGIADDKRNESVGNGLAMFGVSVMGLGALPIVVHLVGNCIEKCF